MSACLPEILSDVDFHGLLLKFDQDLAEEVRQKCCPDCGGALHAGSYPRKPRGTPAGVSPEYSIRLSWCCARRDCRRRATPPSLRFLGPKVYLTTVVVLVTIMRCGATPARLRAIEESAGVSRRTVCRWRNWWSHVFAEGPFWRAAAARFMPPVTTADMPASLLERFAGDQRERLLALLRLLLPITGGRRPVHAV